jgi:hypothetical protein
MNQVYFVVKMLFDANGKPIEGTQQYVSVLADGNAIQAAEEANRIHKRRGRITNEDIIEDAAKRVRPTLSEFPAMRAQ